LLRRLGEIVAGRRLERTLHPAGGERACGGESGYRGKAAD
jgi:hypothetical protein